MRRLIILSGVLLLLLNTGVYADNSIKAEVDKTSLTTDQQLSYKITISSGDRKLSSPKLPEFDGFTIASQIQSSYTSFVMNNEVKSKTVYTYVLIPVKTGILTIPPAKVVIKGEEYQTDTFEIEVIQGKTKPEITPKEKSYPPGKSRPEEGFEQPQYTL